MEYNTFKIFKYIFSFLLLLASENSRAQFGDEYNIDVVLMGYSIENNFLIFKDVLQKDNVLFKQNKVAKITCYNVRDAIDNRIFYIDKNGLVTKASTLFKGSSEHSVYEYNSDNNLTSITTTGEKEVYIDSPHGGSIITATSSRIVFDYLDANVTSISGVRDSTSHFKFNLFYNENKLLQKFIFAEDHIFKNSDMNNLDTTYIEYSNDGKKILLNGKKYGLFAQIKYSGDTIKLSSDTNDSYGVKYIVKDNRVTEGYVFRNSNKIIYSRFFYYDEKGLLIKKVYKNDFEDVEFELLYSYEYYE